MAHIHTPVQYSVNCSHSISGRVASHLFSSKHEKNIVQTQIFSTHASQKAQMSRERRSAKPNLTGLQNAILIAIKKKWSQTHLFCPLSFFTSATCGMKSSQTCIFTQKCNFRFACWNHINHHQCPHDFFTHITSTDCDGRNGPSENWEDGLSRSVGYGRGFFLRRVTWEGVNWNQYGNKCKMDLYGFNDDWE